MRRPQRSWGRGGRTLARALCLAVVVLLGVSAAAPVASANGGTLRAANVSAGPYTVSVYTSPSPLRVGPIDVSVLVQRAGSTEIVQGARVQVVLTSLSTDTPRTAYTFPATREQATNKLFYAAHVDLPAGGSWRVETVVDGPLGTGATAFEVAIGGGIDVGRVVTLGLLAPLPALIVWGTVRAWRQRRAARGLAR